mmetsp:Transcript_10301/g.15827  ORF Transcript_10301/g.15827 Transcript_10301/m.15827 type:complete len:111 (-) Transcript_10301:104-436(-)
MYPTASVIVGFATTCVWSATATNVVHSATGQLPRILGTQTSKKLLKKPQIAFFFMVVLFSRLDQADVAGGGQRKARWAICCKVPCVSSFDCLSLCPRGLQDQCAAGVIWD